MLQFSDLVRGAVNTAVNIASILDGDEAAADVTVTGAQLGDFVLVSAELDAQNLVISGNVRAANTVEVTVANNTGGTIDLASATFRVLVLSKDAFDTVAS